MAPRKSVGGSGTGNGSGSAAGGSKRSAVLAQPTLSFQSRKPSAHSPSKAKKAQAAALAAVVEKKGGSKLKSEKLASGISIDTAIDEDDIEEIEDNQEEEEEEDPEHEDPLINKSKSKSRQKEALAQSKSEVISEVKEEVKDGMEGKENVEKLKGGRRQLDVKSKQWEGVLRDAKAAMGGMKPIHAGPETHDNIHHILRVFDMTSKYGPCVGITRLQRWERAQKWGLNPPTQIRDILTTAQGEDDPSYRENVLSTWL